MRRALPFVLMLCLTAFLMVLTTRQTLHRYHELQSGWSWDLAYYNQWFWALNHGEELTVRPIGPWTQEGPSVWTMNYLAPIRLALVPICRAIPGPETLLVIQTVVFWLVVPAAFGLVKSESGSSVLALSAAALLPLTPLLWPLAWNDFRELQLAPPFVLWAVQGVRARNTRLTVLGVVGLLACRQEFALMVASLALLPPREPEAVARRYRWARALWVIGLGWLLIGFLGYSRWVVNSYALDVFLNELSGKHAPIGITARTAAELLLVGLGSWAILACLVPRAALLTLPWILSVAGGRWAISLIGTEHWHHVRYTAPMVAMVLAAGCLGYARLGAWLGQRRGGPWVLLAAWLLSAAGLLAAGSNLESRFSRIPRPISPAEAEALWSWIDQVGSDDGVLAHYEITAPLSSRRLLYSYVMDQNTPPGYPSLSQDFQWVFARAGDFGTKVLTDQGFQRVHDGPHILVFHRERDAGRPSVASASRNRPIVFPPSERFRVNWRERVYDAFGNAILTLTGVAVTALFLAPGLGLIVWSRRRLDSLKNVSPAGAGLTGEQVISAICRSERLPTVSVVLAEEPFADYFDRQTRSIRLSPGVAAGRSTVDHAIAAREAAHFLSDSQGDLRSLFRDPVVFALRLGMLAGWVLMAAGVVLWSWFPIQAGTLLVTASVAATLPVLWLLERDASRLALECLIRAGIVPEEGLPATRKALSAGNLAQIAAPGDVKAWLESR